MDLTPGRRTVVMTLAYNRPEMVDGALACLEGEDPNREVYIVDVGYPVPDPYENAAAYIKLAEKHGATYIRTKNRSIGKNWTWVLEHLGLGGRDIMVGLDPDIRPNPKGWLRAIKDVFASDERIAVVVPRCKEIEQPYHQARLAQQREAVIKGHRVWEYNYPVAWPMMNYSANFIRACDGLAENARVYGHSECWAHQRIVRMERTYMMLRDFEDGTTLSPDHDYMVWKGMQIPQVWDISFEEWLAEPQKAAIEAAFGQAVADAQTGADGDAHWIAKRTHALLKERGIKTGLAINPGLRL